MSFDVYVKTKACACCGRRPETRAQFNLTHNVNEIVDRCLIAAGGPVAKAGGSEYYQDRSWGRLDGWTTEDALPVATAALAVANDPARETEFKELEPDNRWGSVDAVRKCFARLVEMCSDHPGCVVDTWG